MCPGELSTIVISVLQMRKPQLRDGVNYMLRVTLLETWQSQNQHRGLSDATGHTVPSYSTLTLHFFSSLKDEGGCL